jgi:membrane peptidoglycan carboxypeptidase
MAPRVPSLRSTLLKMHDVIFKIGDARWRVSSDPRLTLLEEAVLILEDHRFLRHRGFDWISIAREITRAVTLRRFGGASTIDIQLFRTMSGRYERTLRRKLREIVGAYALQRKFSKLEILRCYLDCAYFGTKITGVEEASFAMFENPQVRLIWMKHSQ